MDNYLCLGLCIWITLCLGLFHVSAKGDGEIQSLELCQWEEFAESCLDGHVLKIHTARYGRMKLGKCAKKDFGYLGCGIDVVEEVNRKCAGRQECTFTVSSLHVEEHQCISIPDLSPYLELQFSCAPVITCEEVICESSDFLKLSSPSGILASSITSSKQCGSPKCPWILEAKTGQRFNFTLHDYSASPTSTNHDIRDVCHRYATIRENGVTKDITSCNVISDGGAERQWFVTETNEVQVTLYTFGDEEIEEGGSNYVIEYTVIGCGTYDAPPYATVTSNKNGVTVSCIGDDRRWHITCAGTSWVGEHGDCPGVMSAEKQQETDELGNPSPYGMLIVIGMGVALGVVIGVLLLAIALFFIKRRSRQNPGMRNNNLLCDGESPFREQLYKTQTVGSSPGGNVGTLHEHNYTSTLHSSGRVLPPPGLTVFAEDTSSSGQQTPVYFQYAPQGYPRGVGTGRDHVYEMPRFQECMAGNKCHTIGVAIDDISKTDTGGNTRIN